MKWSNEGLDGFARGILALVQEKERLVLEVAELRHELEKERERRKAAETSCSIEAGNLLAVLMVPNVAETLASSDAAKARYQSES